MVNKISFFVELAELALPQRNVIELPDAFLLYEQAGSLLVCR